MLPKYSGLYALTFAFSCMCSTAYSQSSPGRKQDTGGVSRAVAQPWIQAAETPFLQKRSPAKRGKRVQQTTTPADKLKTDSTVFHLNGRKIQLYKTGFPEQITSYFKPLLDGIDTIGYPFIIEPVHFHIVSAATHKDIAFTSSGVRFLKQQADSAVWTAVNTSPQLQMQVTGKISASGVMSFTVAITALQNADLDEIRMHFPLTFPTAQYFRGLGYEGGPRPDTVNWKWDGPVAYGRGAWIGSANAGLWYILEDSNTTATGAPASWSNNGKGGIWVALKGKSILADNYSGKRSMQQGEVVYYNFSMDITPHHLAKHPI